MISSELKAGLLVLAAIAAIAYMTTRLTQTRYSFVGTKTYYSMIADATGLLSNSKIKMAGLDVGQIGRMELVGGQARITLLIAADVVVHSDATIAVKAVGFLGDKYIELHPGSDNKPVLAEGGFIPEGVASGSIDQLTAKTSQLVDSLREITDLLKESLKGEGDGESRLDRILDNMERFSEGLADIDKVSDVIASLSDTVQNLTSISEKVNRGEGTIGKLLTDTQTIDRLNETLSGVNKFVTKADKMQVIVDARGSALLNSAGTRGGFSVALQPTYDKYYRLGVTARPQGRVTEDKRVTTTTSPGDPSAVTVVREEEEISKNGFGIDAQIAKRFGDAVFRLGLFESTAGAAVDYNLFRDRIRLFTEAYRFTTGKYPQVNVGAEVQVFKPFYIWTGGDFLFTRDERSIFVGAGMRFNDQDIKSLVGAAVASGGF